MKLSKIINSKKLSSAKKLAEIDKVVQKCRKAYGNEETEIDSPEIPTSEGTTPLEFLSDDDKVAVASQCITAIRNEAIETVKRNPLAILDSEVIGLISCSPLLVNLNAKNSASEIL
jgi:hypothetical protein